MIKRWVWPFPFISLSSYILLERALSLSLPLFALWTYGERDVSWRASQYFDLGFPGSRSMRNNYGSVRGTEVLADEARLGAEFPGVLLLQCSPPVVIRTHPRLDASRVCSVNVKALEESHEQAVTSACQTQLRLLWSSLGCSFMSSLRQRANWTRASGVCLQWTKNPKSCRYRPRNGWSSV